MENAELDVLSLKTKSVHFPQDIRIEAFLDTDQPLPNESRYYVLETRDFSTGR